MKSKLLQWLGVVLILVTGFIHFILAPVEYEEAHYVGILFGLNFLAAIIAALGILRGKFWGWAVGFLVAAGSIIGYLWSRTTGMPGMEVEEWFTPYGVVALAVECAFILLVMTRPWKSAADRETSTSDWFRYVFPAIALFAMVLTIGLAYMWDAALGENGHGHNGTVTLEDLQNTPQTSLQALEDQYGVRVSLVAVSAMDSIVDVRLKILDVEKAQQLLEQHPEILVNNETLVLPANMHRHRLREGKIYVIYYPNTHRLVENGASVSLVFGKMHVEPVTAQ